MLHANLLRMMSTFLGIYKKGKIFRPQAMKTYMASRGTAPLILNLGPGCFTVGKAPRYPLSRRMGGPQREP